MIYINCLIFLILGICIGLLIKELKKPKQYTFCYCPECKNELCGSDSFIGYTKDGLVLYKCSKCEKETKWYFDTPAPFIID